MQKVCDRQRISLFVYNIDCIWNLSHMIMLLTPNPGKGIIRCNTHLDLGLIEPISIMILYHSYHLDMNYGTKRKANYFFVPFIKLVCQTHLVAIDSFGTWYTDKKQSAINFACAITTIAIFNAICYSYSVSLQEN